MVVNRLWHWYTETVYWPGRLFGSIFSRFPITWICFFFSFGPIDCLKIGDWPLSHCQETSHHKYTGKKTTAEQREEEDPSLNQTVSRRLLSKNMSTLSFPPVTTCSRRGSKYWFHTDVSVFPDDHIFFFTFYCKYTLVWLLITYIAAALREPLMVDPLYKVHGDHW